MTYPTVDKTKVSQSFSQAANDYEQHAFIQQKIAEYLIERLDFIKITPNSILDIGCGAGRMSRQLHRRYPDAMVYGLDIAYQMVTQSRRHAPKPWLWLTPKLSYVCADAERLPIADNSMDLVVSNLTLQWCDAKTVFEEVARILKPDGVFLFSTLGPDTLHELRQSWAAVDEYSHVNFFLDMHDLGDALYQSGLKDPVMDVDWLNFKYDSVDDIMRGLKAIGAHNITSQRPQGLMGKTKFKGMIKDYETRRTEKGLPVTYEVVYGHALGQVEQPETMHNGEVTISIDQIKRLQPTKPQ
ncbi:malonyl-ACP O-methyltransferase BioC [Candidatus Albibeggiatoa sp. nov. NOAA]|uniref:malonyl-ACP O-methyltransferase BioC n=1 Tax=Candidatus Albibeggiatoa sp. nov. NOAA TaxID=3162724 RepID=UPI0032FC3C87|nr:malonyl-ACP O-methyltransferase BioC [Thiotrichaceae bacterium]